MTSTLPEKKLNEARKLVDNFEWSRALQAFEKLTQLFPNKSQIWYQYGFAACRAGQLDRADNALVRALELESAKGDFMLKVAHRYQTLRHPIQARVWFEKAISSDPKSINPRMALAILSEQNHRLAEAREAVESCLAIDPKDDQARYYGAFLDRRENKLEDAERRLRDLIASKPSHQYVQYASRYELAEVLDRTGRFDEAMRVLAEAKGIIRRMVNFELMLTEYEQRAIPHRRATEALPKEILKTWAKEFPPAARERGPKMAFLGGHPRSGTTLLEQVLGAHPHVAAIDETNFFETVACRLLNASPHNSSARLNIIRRRYLTELEKDWGGRLEGKLVLDKNPSFTAQLRVWLKLFPKLRVLIALRDPRDVVISCYFQNIPLNPYNANFLTLERTAKHYADLMDIWLAVRKWDGFAWRETRYEDIVSDLENEGKRVTEFLGLAWNPAQKKFHEKSSQKQIYSPTYRDASQPVYSRSVARWRSYGKHLAPVMPILEPYCRAFGYPC